MLLACHPCTYHFTILFVMSHTSIAACSWLRLAPRWWSSYNAVNQKTLALLSKAKCECVEKSKFEVRDGVSGVSYQDTENTAGWTPVRKKKKTSTATLCFTQASSWSSPETEPVRQWFWNGWSTPQNADADVCLNILGGVPGLQVTTKNSSKWTPIASRTRSKSGTCSN